MNNKERPYSLPPKPSLKKKNKKTDYKKNEEAAIVN